MSLDEQKRPPEATPSESDTVSLLDQLRYLATEGDLVPYLLQVPPSRLASIARDLGDEVFGDLLGTLDPTDAAEILSRLAVADAADVLEAMAPDEAADVMGEFAPEAADRILIEMEPVEAAELRDLLAYPPDTAGGRMTPAFVSIAPDLRADQAILALRRLAQEAEGVTYVYVTDPHDRLLGVLSLRNLVLSPPHRRVGDLMVTDLITVPATADQEEAAHLLTENNLLALPVVDDQQRLLGIITADDVADILAQEATEDITRLGASEPLEEPYLRVSPIILWRKRIVWLFVLFVAQAYTGTVLQFFETELAEVIALSFFIPMLIGTGGNAGSQVVMTLVRAMTLGEVRFRDLPRVVSKEFATGLMLGITMAVATFIRALMLDVGVDVGLVVAAAVTAIVVWAAVVGAILPMVLRQLKVDPTVVSAPFISTLVDGTGLLIYFTIARMVLRLG
ncbi:magnesium transporter [Sphaerobacter sp.]|uniref:magnesium transporter n=1 Tax=Sphaerobacter sp. TaxID=2099654 RepID=UPI001D75C3AE|nr:magnesium transporter [Sphaerobacter sp.]MBX5445978.1 magnesium transporter [Sphaerobacter sp.]